jgi:lipopolysaccharide biosynthesis protein
MINCNLLRMMKQLFWKLPINSNLKEKLRRIRAEAIVRKEEEVDKKKQVRIRQNTSDIEQYVKELLKQPDQKASDYKQYRLYDKHKGDVVLAAYYLTQYHPNKENDEWWGKGITEWNNVSRAVPQFAGHYQPRKPGELGYYDLRIKENMERQIELAKNYGISAFCFYYYWFDGHRLLELPLNNFLNNRELDMPFFYCWANENWTKRFTGTNSGTLIEITQDEKNYIQFIESILNDMEDERYYTIHGKPVLSVYRPSLIPNPEKVLSEWKRKAQSLIGKDLYIIAIQERDTRHNWISVGFDAESEFHPKQIQHYCKEISTAVKPIRKDFSGNIYDYEDMVKTKKYILKDNIGKKVYPAVMPMWDNTARRNFRGTIYHNSSPQLYKLWLADVLKRIQTNKYLDTKLAFINAWNEWGEGTYLEPDSFYGYAYLDATREAIDQLGK